MLRWWSMVKHAGLKLLSLTVRRFKSCSQHFIHGEVEAGATKKYDRLSSVLPPSPPIP